MTSTYCNRSGLISFLRWTVPIAGFWYGKEKLQFLREKEGEYHWNKELRLQAKIKQVEAVKNKEIDEINKKHQDVIANYELELLKASGKWTPPSTSSSDKTDSLRFVESLLDGKWEGWMDDYVSNKLFQDIATAFEKNDESFFLNSSQAILDKMNQL
eukprot:TRINITY_DN518_c0_g1_i1.p1 TRINITY_DN518_c0_g1~~TRINITY_DN518_c0_g1_i1.p1  ORF type:complete len:157 (-),score=44.82 TRINITY_DN518_c0_g1_i1:54-524(-)